MRCWVLDTWRCPGIVGGVRDTQNPGCGKLDAALPAHLRYNKPFLFLEIYTLILYYIYINIIDYIDTHIYIYT